MVRFSTSRFRVKFREQTRGWIFWFDGCLCWFFSLASPAENFLKHFRQRFMWLLKTATSVSNLLKNILLVVNFWTRIHHLFCVVFIMIMTSIFIESWCGFCALQRFESFAAAFVHMLFWIRCSIWESFSQGAVSRSRFGIVGWDARRINFDFSILCLLCLTLLLSLPFQISFYMFQCVYVFGFLFFFSFLAFFVFLAFIFVSASFLSFLYFFFRACLCHFSILPLSFFNFVNFLCLFYLLDFPGSAMRIFFRFLIIMFSLDLILSISSSFWTLKYFSQFFILHIEKHSI